jgi:hypothetical protein
MEVMHRNASLNCIIIYLFNLFIYLFIYLFIVPASLVLYSYGNLFEDLFKWPNFTSCILQSILFGIFYTKLEAYLKQLVWSIVKYLLWISLYLLNSIKFLSFKLLFNLWKQDSVSTLDVLADVFL